MNPSVAIILLNWQGWRDTLLCLQSLRELDYPEYRVVVVDNGSVDESVREIQRAAPDVELIQTGRNLGFAGGCNVGIQKAMAERAEYVWLLNNDTVVDTRALTELVATAETSRAIGAVGSVIYDMFHTEQVQAWGGGSVNLWTGQSRHRHHPGQLDYITGASILLRTAAVAKTGLLDDGFFLYWEETDLCFRLRDAGWTLAVAQNSRIFHKESASLMGKDSRKDMLFNESAVKFFKRHAPIPLLPITIGVLGRAAKRFVRGDIGLMLAVLRGAWRGMSGPGK